MVGQLGGQVANRELHFIWICDCSGSMSLDGKMESLNTSIREALQAMRDAADENPLAKLMVRAVKFSTGAQWHITDPTPAEEFEWVDLDADGVTDMGIALKMVADQLESKLMPERGLRPVLVLVSDGQPTDDYQAGIDAIMAQPWGQKAIRLAIAIGSDAELGPLEKFIGHPEIKPLVANNAPTLTRFIRWVSTVPVKIASSPRIVEQEEGEEAPLIMPMPEAPDEDEEETW